MDFYFQRQYRGPLKGILLDWAGTTMDYCCYAPATVFVEVYRRKGVPIAVDEARVPMGAHKKVHVRKISQLPELTQRWQAALGRQPNEDDIEGMPRGLREPDTGYTGEIMKLLHEAKKRNDAPDSTVCATDVPAGRPEPWMCV